MWCIKAKTPESKIAGLLCQFVAMWRWAGCFTTLSLPVLVTLHPHHCEDCHWRVRHCTWHVEVPLKGSSYGQDFASFNPLISHPFYRWANWGPVRRSSPVQCHRVGKEWPLVPQPRALPSLNLRPESCRAWRPGTFRHIHIENGWTKGRSEGPRKTTLASSSQKKIIIISEWGQAVKVGKIEWGQSCWKIQRIRQLFSARVLAADGEAPTSVSYGKPPLKHQFEKIH